MGAEHLVSHAERRLPHADQRRDRFPLHLRRRVGLGRTYVKLDGALTFAGWLNGLRDGRSYVSDGKSHLIDFTVNGVGVGRGGSELKMPAPRPVKVTRAAWRRYLDPVPNEAIRTRPLDQKPYWDVERARIGNTRKVPVEVVVNGSVVATRTVAADGQIRDVEFDVPVERSSWIAARVLPSSHTNPVFVLVGGKPIRASRRSAEWCLKAVDQCWTQKAPAIRASERAEARAAYDHARAVYKRLVAESSTP